MIDFPLAASLFLAGVIAGLCNAIAGGGTFFSFPVFIAAGIPPAVANASNAVSVWPGHALAIVGYRRELGLFFDKKGGSLIIALAGGAAGGVLLAVVGNDGFSRLIPFLILFATVLFAFGRKLNEKIAALNLRFRHSGTRRAFSVAFEFLVAVYGGFFGAGLGVMLMAWLQMLGRGDMHANNAVKNLLGAAITSVAVVVFVALDMVSWPHTAIAFAGSMIGGLWGGRVARKIPERLLRMTVIGVGLLLGVYYFGKYY
ncbi:MAG: sulfite exporter TauE/SafE family protein [Gammaproteobacteria bacterium]